MRDLKKSRMKRSWDRWPTYSPQCRRDVLALLRDGTRLTALQANPKVGPGPREGSWCWQLERLATRMTGRDTIACANATLGLTAALRALGLPAGSSVATTAFTFSATSAAIVHAGLRPEFFDIHPERMTMDSAKLHGALPGIKAVLPVDLFGRVHNGGWPVPCVQDACQAVGSDGAGRTAIGDFVVWSFNGRKNVPAGEGGMVLAPDPEAARHVRLWLSHGENFGARHPGTNGHLNELSACVAFHGLRRVQSRNAVRRLRAALLTRLLQGCPLRVFPDSNDHAFYVYPAILEASVDRPRLVAALARLGVHSQPGYIEPPIHEYLAFSEYQRRLPVTEELSRKTLLLLPTQITSCTTAADVRWLAARIRMAFAIIGT